MCISAPQVRRLGTALALAAACLLPRLANSTDAAPPETVLASNLVGASVSNASGSGAGWVDDLVIDVNNSRVYCFLVAWPRLWGLWATVRAYPPSRLWPDLGRDGLTLSTHAADADDAALRLEGMAWATQARSPRLMRASSLLGKAVTDDRGSMAGVIEDLAFDPVDGAVVFATVRLRSGSSPAGRAVHIPFTDIVYRRAQPAVLRDSASAWRQAISGKPER